jgi:hypothetical protein
VDWSGATVAGAKGAIDWNTIIALVIQYLPDLLALLAAFGIVIP